MGITESQKKNRSMKIAKQKNLGQEDRKSRERNQSFRGHFLTRSSRAKKEKLLRS